MKITLTKAQIHVLSIRAASAHINYDAETGKAIEDAVELLAVDESVIEFNNAFCEAYRSLRTMRERMLAN